MTPYDHPDWNALLAGVAAHPDADLPRLVAADWLEERGEEDRAAFIRLQCEREFDDRVELKWAEERYRNSPVGLPRWAAEASPGLVRLEFAPGGSLGVVVRGAEKVTFRRGFPERVVCTADEWQRHGALTVPRQPVRQLVLRECREPGLDWWAMLAVLRPLRQVALDDGDYPLLRFLRRELPGVDVVRHAGPPAPALDPPLPLRAVAPPPRLVHLPAAERVSNTAAGPTG